MKLKTGIAMLYQVYNPFTLTKQMLMVFWTMRFVMKVICIYLKVVSTISIISEQLRYKTINFVSHTFVLNHSCSRQQAAQGFFLLFVAKHQI